MATSGSPTGVEDDLWSKPDETINEKIKDLCPIVITTILMYRMRSPSRTASCTRSRTRTARSAPN